MWMIIIKCRSAKIKGQFHYPIRFLFKRFCKVREAVTLLPGSCLNIKTVFPRHGDSHVKDKAVVRPSYLEHGDPYTDKMTSLYWARPQVVWLWWMLQGHCCQDTCQILNNQTNLCTNESSQLRDFAKTTMKCLDIGYWNGHLGPNLV